MNKMSTIITLIVIIALITLGTTVFILNKSKLAAINSFEDCAAAGYPIMDSYPEQCRTADGKHFTRSVSNQPISVIGNIICLPKRNPGEVQTLECAFGIQDESDVNYALNDPEMRYIPTLPMGTKIQLSGTLDRSKAAESNYDIEGTITVNSVTSPTTP
jgi:hypothetical protein